MHKDVQIFLFLFCIITSLAGLIGTKQRIDKLETKILGFIICNEDDGLRINNLEKQIINLKKSNNELIQLITSLQDKIHTNYNLYLQLNEQFDNFKYDTGKHIKILYYNINIKIEQLNNEVAQLYRYLNLGLLRPVTQEEIDDRRTSTQNSDRCASTTQGYTLRKIYRVSRAGYRRKCKTGQNEFKSRLGRQTSNRQFHAAITR